MQPHEKLETWRLSRQLVLEVYRATEEFPHGEKYELVSQMRSAAISVPSQIAEGAARKSTNEYIHYLYIARGSLNELRTQILLSHDLKLLETPDKTKICNLIAKIGPKLTTQIQSLQNKTT